MVWLYCDSNIFGNQRHCYNNETIICEYRTIPISVQPHQLTAGVERRIPIERRLGSTINEIDYPTKCSIQSCNECNYNKG